jgi:hypothetical protein
LLRLEFIEYRVVLNLHSCNNPADVMANLGAREIYGGHAVWLTDLLINVFHAVADNAVVTTINWNARCSKSKL